MEIMKQVEEIDFKNELSDLKEEVFDNHQKNTEKTDKQKDIKELIASWDYDRNQEKKTLGFFYNITEFKKRDAEIYIQDDWDNVIVSIDAYNTIWRNGEDVDLAKSFKKSEINKVPSYLKNTFEKWFNFETIFWLDENLKVKSSRLLEKIEKKAEWWVKLFNHYTEIKKESKEK